MDKQDDMIEVTIHYNRKKTNKDFIWYSEQVGIPMKDLYSSNLDEMDDDVYSLYYSDIQKYKEAQSKVEKYGGKDHIIETIIKAKKKIGLISKVPRDDYYKYWDKELISTITAYETIMKRFGGKI